jgi:hypothetical protein
MMKVEELIMRTREIPTLQWSDFLDRFSRSHDGAPVTIEIFGPEIGTHTEVRRSTLRGVTSDHHGQPAIDILVGTEHDGHVDHRVARPRRIYVGLTEAEMDEILGIEDDDGNTTVVRLLQPLLLA